MKHRGIKLALVASALTATCVMAAPDGDLKHMGYSQEMINEVMCATGCEPVAADADEQSVSDEADSTQEQLTELGVTRSLTPDLDDRSGAIRDEILNYWDKMTPEEKKLEPISPEIKTTIEAGIKTALEAAGFRIVQLNILDLPEGSLQNALRVVVRVTRPLKTRNSYQEIQKNLLEIRKICSEAATINDVNYLSEMTTFVAENPRNNYYYEKTILRP